MKVWIVGAGPGDPELVTVKGRRLIHEADIIVFAGSLVNPALLNGVRTGIPTLDSSHMTLNEVCELYFSEATDSRRHSGRNWRGEF